MYSSRLVLAGMVLSILTVAVATQAQQPGTPKSLEISKIKDDLRLREQILARQFAEFERSLLQLKQRLERSPKQEDRERAAVLAKVLEECQNLSIGVQFEQLQKFLEKANFQGIPDLKSGVEKTNQLADSLRKILDAMREDSRHAKLRDERLNLEKMIKELERIIHNQKVTQGITESGRTDSKELKKIQGKVTDDTAKLAKAMAEKGVGPDGKNLPTKGDNKEAGKQGGKAGETKDAGKGSQSEKAQAKEGGDSKEAKGDAKGSPDSKSGDKSGKEGSPAEAKAGGKGSESKEGGAKGSKGSEGSQGNAKEGGKEGGDKKEATAKDGGEKSGEKGEPKGGIKTAEKEKTGDKTGDKSGDKGPQAQAKAGPKDSEKQGGAKGSKQGDDKQGDSKSGGDPKQADAKSGESSQGQGQAKAGGQQGPPPSGGEKDQPPKAGPQDPKDNVASGKKQVEDANYEQKKAEDNIAKKDNKQASDNQGQAIKDLESAKKKLEDLLRQLREEELERLLAALQARCEKMLAMQMQVLAGTVRVEKDINNNPEKKVLRENQQSSLKLSDNEKDIVLEASKAIEMLEAEGSAVAFPEVFQQVREDMKVVQRRLEITDIGQVTQAIEQDIIDTLKEMIEALKKARQEMDAKKSPPGPPGQQSPQADQKLLDQIAELKMIRSMQLRVNARTTTYGKMYVPKEGEQTADPMIRRELQGLSERQERIFDITHRIAKGDNK